MIKLFAQITKPENGYKADTEVCEEHIELFGAEHLYEVQRVDIGRSSTDVHLVDMRWEFNSVNLSFFISEDGKQVREYDIFENKLNLKCIQHTYINMLLS